MSVIVTVQIPFGPDPYMAIYEIRNTTRRTEGGGVMYDVSAVGGDKITQVEHRRDRGVTDLVSKAMRAVNQSQFVDPPQHRE